MVTNFERLTVDSLAEMVGGILENNVFDCGDCPFDEFCRNNDCVTCSATVKKWANAKTSTIDEVEKEYLKAVLAPWLKRKKTPITVTKVVEYERKYLRITVGDELVNLPYFYSDEMYKGMEASKIYTVEQLGLR